MRGLFGTLAAGIERKAVDVSPLTWARLWGEDATVKSGVSVSTDTAARNATCIACCRVLAEGIAQLPFKLYRARADGRGADLAIDHPLYRVLYRQPNGWMTSFEFRETAMWHAVLGNGFFAYILRRDGVVRELIPLVPGRVRPVMGKRMMLQYEVDGYDGLGPILHTSDVFVIRGPSWDGVAALEMVQQAREAIGLSIATEETHARLFAQGARPGGILYTDAKLNQATIDKLKAQWADYYEGVAKHFKTVVLDGGLKWQPTAFTGVDAQHLETRKHQIEEISRVFRVFPQMIGFSDKTATFASAESFFRAHVVHSLQPWIERWEQRVEKDLIGEADAHAGLYAKMSVQAFLRGDSKARAAFYTAMFNMGAMSPNEIRELEELNPYDGGDEYRVPLNTGPAGVDDTGGGDPAVAPDGVD